MTHRTQPLAFACLVFACSALLAPRPSALAPQEDSARQEAREAAFAQLLSGARLVGYFTDSSAPEGKLSKDSYTIDKVSPVGDGKWLFEAKVEFGERAVPVSITLPVEWAGDTPVISLTDMSFPLLGSYSARVLFHDGQYAGLWSGKSHGGQMFGRIERAQAAPAAPQPHTGDDERAVRAQSDDEQARQQPVAAREPAAVRPYQEGVDWPSFRGQAASGVSSGFPTPTEWNLESGENVRWRVEVPGLAHSSPIIWGDKLFVTTAVRAAGEQELKVGLYGSIFPVQDESEFRFELHCYDKNSGKQLWTRECWHGVPPVKRHPKGSHAASTPATDGEHVLAFFGSCGLYCYDLEGQLLWTRDFGKLDSGFYMMKAAEWGFASSPVLHEGKVILQVDVQQNSFVAALDARTGEDLWHTPRKEVPTWSTPSVDVRPGRRQVICNGWKHIGGYDLDSGAELWKLEGGGDIPVPTPVLAGDTIFITNAHGSMAPIYAIDALAKGTLTMDPAETEAMRWSTARRGNYMQTPLVVGDEIYFCSDAGILACYRTQTGEEVFRERLGEGTTGFTSSGVSADGALYFASEEGDVQVVTAGFFEVLAVNSLGEECMASPAISEGVLYYRTRGHLVAVGL